MNYDNQKDEEIEKKIMTILSGQEKALEQLDTHVNELKGQEIELNQELQMKKVELERAEKRLESLQHAQPQHLSEISQYENELSIIYRLYVEKIRNHDYLQSRVDKYQKLEDQKQKDFKTILEKNKVAENEKLKGGDDVIVNSGMNLNRKKKKIIKEDSRLLIQKEMRLKENLVMKRWMNLMMMMNTFKRLYFN